MGVTGTCAEIYYLALPEQVDLEDHPIARDDAIASFRNRFQPVPEDQRVGVDVDDNLFE